MSVNNGLKILCFNGPPSSGKDTMAKYLRRNWLKEQNGDAVLTFERFSRPLKTTFAAIVARDFNEFFEVEHYEQHKEEIVPSLGVSFRQYQIDFSEKFAKPLYGNDIFARWLYARISREWTPEEIIKASGGFASTNPDNHLIVIPDCGFDIEVNYLTQFYTDNMLLIRMHRPGCDFKGDSRNYVYTDKCANIDVHCDADVGHTERAAMRIADHFSMFQNNWSVRRNKTITDYYTSEFGRDIRL